MANEFKVKKGLIVHGSGSTVLDIQGNSGQLFSVTDDLTGTLFTVSDISGIPIFEVDASGVSTFDGDVQLPSTPAATTDTDKFVVLDSGVLKYRTGAQLLSDIGAGSGTVTSVGGTGTVSGLTLTGTVTTSGNLTLGGTLTLTSGQITTGLGFTPYNATNPAGYTTNTGTVTSVGGTGTVSGLTLTGTVTTSGNLTLGGTLTLTSGQITTGLGFTPYNATNPAGYTTNTGTVTGTGTTNYISKWTSTTAQGNSQIFDNGTYVGIGTTSPSYKLDVAGDMNVAINGGFNTNRLNFHEGFSYIEAATLFGSGYISMNIGSAEVYLSSGGDVGVGTSSPSAKLSVAGDVSISTNAHVRGKFLAGEDALPYSDHTLANGGSSAITPDTFAVNTVSGQILTGQTSGETLENGHLVYLRSNGSWYLADADQTATSISLLGIALKDVTGVGTIDVLIDGIIGIEEDFIEYSNIGEPLYIDTAGGKMTRIAPSGTGDVVRVVGHYLGADSTATGVLVAFKPDGTWIEL